MSLSQQQLATVQRVIERQNGDTTSQQPRFTNDTNMVFGSVLRWLRDAEIEEPPYAADSRNRDKWLRNFWRREPHLAGVVKGAVAVDKNRSWTLTGGRNQVSRYSFILRNYEDGLGWRWGISKAALAYYTQDMGAVVETGRDGFSPPGPLRGLYHVDQARCKLTGNPREPLQYYPAQGGGGHITWTHDHFFRVTDMPSTDEKFNDLGFCAESRALEVAKVLYAVYQHDQEKLLARAPRGLMILHNISEQQWETAMQARDEKLDSREARYFGAVAVIASAGIEQADATLVALSELPDNFDRKEFVDLCMYGYALCFGYDPREFWPVTGTPLGTATEAEVMHRKSGGKGGLSFVLDFQDRLQRELPETLVFEFAQRDRAGQKLAAEIAEIWTNVATALHSAGIAPDGSGEHLLPREEALSLLAMNEVLPPDWTELLEDARASDTSARRIKRMRHQAMENARIRRAVEGTALYYPSEPIVRYTYEHPFEREVVLWERADDAVSQSAWAGATVQRQEELDEDDETVLFSSDDGEVVITVADAARAQREGRTRTGDEWYELMTATELSDDELDEFEELDA